jgi:hypothetical protein
MRDLAKGLVLGEGRSASVGGGIAGDPPARLAGPGPRWALIKHSLDVADYDDFLDVFPNTDQVFEARRHKRLLDEWTALDRDDVAVLEVFLAKRSFPALDRLARTAVSRLEDLARERRERWARLPGPASARATPPPGWVIDFGQDRFGAYARFTVGGVGQTLRWISPGTFQMGSPDDKPGRIDDEGPRHGVTLSAGFWLFDTPCTQALRQAVMGDNPSRFNSPERPVDTISW